MRLLLCLLCCALWSAALPAAALPCEGQVKAAEVTGLSKDLDRLAVRDAAAAAEGLELVVPESLRERLKAASVGDRVALAWRCGEATGTPPVQAPTLRRIDWPSAGLPRAQAVLTLVASAGLLALAAFILMRKPPWRLAVGLDNRYSTSKFQVLVWFWVLLSSYLAWTLARLCAGGMGYVGGIDIPASLLTLSGISTLSFATAKGITTSKVQTATAGGAEVKVAAREAQTSDLVQDDFQRLNLSDLQVVLLTLLAAGLYLVSVVAGLESLLLQRKALLPEVDGTLLGLLGVSHAGYLGIKAASEPGAALTPQQAAARATAALDTLRTWQQRVADVSKAAATAAAETADGLKVAAKAARKVDAQLGADRATTAGPLAVAAAAEAATALAAVRNEADALLKLGQDWGAHAEVGAAVRAASTEAQKLLAQAQQDAAQAATAGQQARLDAESAQRQRDAKP